MNGQRPCHRSKNKQQGKVLRNENSLEKLFGGDRVVAKEVKRKGKQVLKIYSRKRTLDTMCDF